MSVEPAPFFSRRFIKSLDSWVAGSRNKVSKAKEVKKILRNEPIDRVYLVCDEPCYRRAILNKEAVSKLFFNFNLAEETSSWTISRQVAADLKGGPADPPDATVIFRRCPAPREVILNLFLLMNDERFWPCVDFWVANGLRLNDKGLKYWANTQKEVILDVDRVPHTQIDGFGGNAVGNWASGQVGTVRRIGDTRHTHTEIERQMGEHSLSPRRFVYGDSVATIYHRWVARVLQLKVTLPPGMSA